MGDTCRPTGEGSSHCSANGPMCTTGLTGACNQRKRVCKHPNGLDEPTNIKLGRARPRGAGPGHLLMHADQSTRLRPIARRALGDLHVGPTGSRMALTIRGTDYEREGRSNGFAKTFDYSLQTPANSRAPAGKRIFGRKQCSTQASNTRDSCAEADSEPGEFVRAIERDLG